ncbi:MAG: hypothetical protein KGJ41_09790 [Rhodospirillales bacterium]|nr:hypothetical protein [Rhodospirillales bacterium]MDE2199304.1 hypothetical protein [Rhodospirillales bacterium]MDE2575997.1 hypothetical protein [Rhodospirillales bacterium]
MLVFGLGAALLHAAPAAAQIDSREGIALHNEILKLRADLDDLRARLGRGGGSGGSMLGSAAAPPPAHSGAGSDITASLLDRVNRLEDEVRSLRGKLDETNNALQQQNADLTKQIGDLSFRLDNGAGTASPPAPAPTLSPAPAPLGGGPAKPLAPARRTPELAMQEGNAALARRDYAIAERDAREVLAGPRTPRSIDAQFLLAQAMAGRKDYQGAAVAYDDTYNRSRTGPHAQDSLLGIATSLTAINEKRAACATLDKLKAEFPSPRRDLLGPIAATRRSAGCR